jgi:hypothetical protein
MVIPRLWVMDNILGGKGPDTFRYNSRAEWGDGPRPSGRPGGRARQSLWKSLCSLPDRSGGTVLLGGRRTVRRSPRRLPARHCRGHDLVVRGVRSLSETFPATYILSPPLQGVLIHDIKNL